MRENETDLLRPKRWNLDRLAECENEEALAEQGLSEWVSKLDDEDGGRDSSS